MELQNIKKNGQTFTANTMALNLANKAVSGLVLGDGKAQSTIELGDNFTFSDLFSDFNSPNADLFVFDDAKIDITASGLSLSSLNAENKIDNTITFSGKLKLKGTLETFKNFLQSDSSVLMTVEIVSQSSIKDKIQAQAITLKSVASFHLPLFSGVTLTTLGMELIITPTGDSWKMVPTLEGMLSINNITDGSKGKINASISENSGLLSLSAYGSNIVGAFGIPTLTLNKAKISGELSNQKQQLTINSELSSGALTYKLAGTINDKAVGMVAEIAQFGVDDIASLFADTFGSPLSLPEFDLSFNQSSLCLASNDCEVNGKKLSKGISVLSAITAHGLTINTSASLTASGITFSGLLKNMDIGPVHIKQAGLQFSMVKKSNLSSSVFSLAGKSTIQNIDVDCGIYFEKQASSFNTVLYATLSAETLSLSTLFPEAKDSFADTLKFSKAGFVFASNDCKTQNPAFSFEVEKGLQLISVVEEVPGLSELTGEKHIGLLMSAHIGKTIDISIEVPNSRIDLGHSVQTAPLKVKVFLAPKVSVMAIFGVEIGIPNQSQPLHFDMALDLSLIQATGSVTMKHYWNNPFGIQGLKIGPAVALQLGLIYQQFAATGIPSEFGIAGGLAIGNSTVNMGVNISENPMNEILSGSLKQLSTTDLVEFASDLIEIDIPSQDIPNFIDIKNLEIYIAPAGGMIGTIKYDPGFSFSCDMVVLDKKIQSYVRISDNGIEGKGHIDGLEIGPLKIAGDQGKDAAASLILSTTKQELAIDGAIAFLGSNEGIYALINNKEIIFNFHRNLVGLLRYQVNGASSGNISNPAALDFTLSADMQNDITAYLKGQATQKIDHALSDTTRDINQAIAEVDATKKSYMDLYTPAYQEMDNATQQADAYLHKLATELSDTKSQFHHDLANAEQAVVQATQAYQKAFNDAEQAVTATSAVYTNALNAAKRELDNAEQAYTSAFNAAQNEVSKAQQDYNNGIGSAQNTLNDAIRKVNSLQHDIDATNREISGLTFWTRGPMIWLVPKLAGLEAARLIANTALNLANGILEGIKFGGNYTVFEAAKATLECIKQGGKYAAFASAKSTLNLVQQGGEYVAFETAKKALSAMSTGGAYVAKETTNKALSAVKISGNAAIDAASFALANISTSAVYVAMDAAKLGLKGIEEGTAATTFDNAKSALEAAKLSTEGVFKLAEFAAKHSGDFIDIKNIHLSGSLKEIESGELFDASIAVAVLGHDYQWNIDFDANDVTGFIEQLFKQALKEGKSVISV